MQEGSRLEALYQARKCGTSVDAWADGLSLEDALKLQLDVADRFAAEGEMIGGWKVGLTSGPARDSMGKNYRPFGFVLSSRIFPSGARIPYAGILNCAIEAELCLVVDSPLRGAISPDAARASTRGVAPSLELVERRISSTRPDHATMLADGLNNWGMVVGDDILPEDFSQEDTTAKLTRSDELIASARAGVDLVIDDVFMSLSMLCRELDKYGRGIDAGQTVLTGAFVMAKVSAPSQWTARFADLGEVSVSFI